MWPNVFVYLWNILVFFFQVLPHQPPPPPVCGHHCCHWAPQWLPIFGLNRSSSSTHHDNITTHGCCHITATTHVRVITAAYQHRQCLRRPRHRCWQCPATTSPPTTPVHAMSPTTTTCKCHIATPVFLSLGDVDAMPPPSTESISRSRKIRRSQEEGSGDSRMRRRGGNRRGCKGTGRRVLVPPPSCSIVPEASEAARNLHATSSELLYPSDDEGFMVSTTGQCDTHALPSFSSSYFSSHHWGDPFHGINNRAECNPYSAPFELISSSPCLLYWLVYINVNYKYHKVIFLL